MMNFGHYGRAVCLVLAFSLWTVLFTVPALSAFDKKDPFSDPEFREPYLVGVDAYDEGDYETALKAFIPLSEDNDFRAQIYLGTMYEKGLGLKADLAKAAHWYHEAAEGALEAFFHERNHADEWRRRLLANEAAIYALEQRNRQLQETLDNIRRQLPGYGGVRPTAPQ